MHLHGFPFTVDERGDGNRTVTVEDEREVTEAMAPGSTVALHWSAERSGTWLMHCHIAYHNLAHAPIDAMLSGHIKGRYALLRNFDMGGWYSPSRSSRTRIEPQHPRPRRIGKSR